MLKLLTGISPLRAAITGGIVVAIALFVWSWVARGNTIDELRGEIAAERYAHEITLSSLAQVTKELNDQSMAVELQRVAREQAQRDLAVAVEASAPSKSLVDRLIASARNTPAGQVCEPSAVTKEIWK